MTGILPDKIPVYDIDYDFLNNKSHESVFLCGVRGYNLDEGTPQKNDRGIYDDAIFVCGPDLYIGFNANCDPSFGRKGMATLKCGTWKYKIGKHKGYKALVQADVVTVTRDDQDDETGWFGINIHKGGYKTTGSLGCQTIHPKHWDSFISVVSSRIIKHGQKHILYFLTEKT